MGTEFRIVRYATGIDTSAFRIEKQDHRGEWQPVRSNIFSIGQARKIRDNLKAIEDTPDEVVE